MLISSVWRGGSRWIFSLGLLAGAVTVALLVAAAGALLVRWWLPAWAATALVLLVLAVSVVNDIGLVRIPLPQNARQVPEQIARTGPVAGALWFGFEMGMGMRTFMTSALPHVVLVSVMVLADPMAALAAGLGFGFGRAVVPLGRRVAGDGWSDLFVKHARVTGVVLTLTVMVCVAAWIH